MASLSQERTESAAAEATAQAAKAAADAVVLASASAAISVSAATSAASSAVTSSRAAAHAAAAAALGADAALAFQSLLNSVSTASQVALEITRDDIVDIVAKIEAATAEAVLAADVLIDELAARGTSRPAAQPKEGTPVAAGPQVSIPAGTSASDNLGGQDAPEVKTPGASLDQTLLLEMIQTAKHATKSVAKAAKTAAELLADRNTVSVLAAAEVALSAAKNATKISKAAAESSSAAATTSAAAAIASIEAATSAKASNEAASAAVKSAKDSAEAVTSAAYAAAKAAAAAVAEKNAADVASHFKTRFISNMSHEIRTPLAIIRGYAELFNVAHLIGSEPKLWIEKIIHASKILELLIHDILDISRIEAGKTEIDMAPFALAEMIVELQELLSLQAVETGISLDFAIEGLVPSQITTDRLRLRQILLNVIGNAIKFTEQGRVGVLIKLMAAGDHAPHPLLAFVISDTGIGMDPEQVQKIFGAFTQADSSITRRYGGSGLGLALSLGLARLLDGDIVVNKSELGKGSTFTVTIDPGSLAGVAMQDGSTILASRPCASPKVSSVLPSLHGMRILIVEDAADIRELVKYCLSAQGAIVTEASNGKEAIQQAFGHAFDLIMMDIQMPVLDGVEATQQLRQAGCQLPIVALTAHAMVGERERLLSKGFTAYLSKPIDIVQMLDLVSRYRQASGIVPPKAENQPLLLS